MLFLKKVPTKAWIIFLACLIISCLSYFRIFENYELISYDLRLRLRPPLETSKDILIIEISDDTLKNLGKWPLPRDFHASLINVLKELGAKQIVFDVLFSTPTLYDETFVQAIDNAKNVYLGLAFYIKAETIKNNFLPPKTNKILEGISSTIEKSGYRDGHINVFIDPDGKIRRMPIFINYNGKFIPHLGLKVAIERLGLNIENLEFKQNKVIIDKKLFLPTSVANSFIVNYPDKWEKSFIHFSYFEILKSYADLKKNIKPQIDLSIIKNKTCFIGLTATGTSDLRAMPLENIYPMLGLQASVFNSIIEKKFIIDIGLLFNTFISILIFLLSFLICLRFSPLKSFFTNTIFGLLYFLIATCLLIFYGAWMDLFLPLLIIAFCYLGSTLYRIIDETRKRQLLEKELDIAQEIQKSFLPQDIKEFSGLDIACFMQPAKFVAGDFYDIMPINDKKISVVIGDVSGKGVPASLIMAQTISYSRIFSRQYSNCWEILKNLNNELTSILSGRFVTCLYLMVDTQNHKIYASSAGHSPLLFYKKSENKILEVDLSAEVPLGITEDTAYKEIVFDIEKDDKIIIFTDGVTEARNKKGQEFGVDNIKKIILDNVNFNSKETLAAIKEELFKFSYKTPQHDDITIIVLSF